jgi:putative protease
MNIASGKGCNALSRHGVSRVVLARELSLEELRSIRSETNMELEIFVHGALCVSASGLCLFSSYLGGKSANRGMCTQACRRLYSSGDTDSGYYFSPADLQLLEHLPDIAAAGINALKIEGRMKSADYVGAVVSAYRLALDAVIDGSEEKIRSAIAQARKILRGDFARSKTVFFFFFSNAENSVSWLNPSQDGGTGINLGLIQKAQGRAGERRAFIFPEAGILPAEGDSIRLHRSNDSGRLSHKLQFVEASKEGSPSGEGVWISVPDGFDKGDRVYLIQTRAMSKRHRPVISSSTPKGGRQPGHEKAPLPAIIPPSQKSTRNAERPGKQMPQDRVSKKTAGKSEGIKRKDAAGFPEGLYVAVSNVNDLYIAQSSRPAMVMLSLNRKNAQYLTSEGKQPLPFKPADIILTLEPFFPQADAEYFDRVIPELVDRGYRQFALNNLGHLSLFRDFRPELRLIAGPWLYTFNAWALSYIVSLGVNGIISPLENNRQNLERSIGMGKDRLPRSMLFVPVFAWPPLFQIRSDLKPLYHFKTFSDNRGENFSLICENEGSRVIPEKPFSIIDKIPFLQEAGYLHFVIDLSGSSLKKTDYKDLMRAAKNGTPLPRVSRFNWKNGFFNADADGASVTNIQK